MSSVKVSVRVRPFNSRELKHDAKCIIEMQNKTTKIINPDNGKPNSFTFDFSHWSHVKDEHFANQEKVYGDIGKEMLEHSFEGYNICIFAYGQTGAGKSYSMMGTPEPNEQGIIPRACEELFARIGGNKDPNVTFSVEVSYMEIYNEKVRDLLNPRSQGNLKVREHPVFGPYVEDLSKILVTSFLDVQNLMDEGNKSRTVAATNMNETSSRSHAVFSLVFTQQTQSKDTNSVSEKVSKISLVDLAGSERADSTGATGTRLKEGANINKSLTTLGKVIAALAELSDPKKKKKNSGEFVPYRDSVLTWLLKESLGGNSKTAMVAAISPADINYDETLSTLRYADRAKQIVCQAIVNEDPNVRMIRDLKGEIERLKVLLQRSGLKLEGTVFDSSAPMSLPRHDDDHGDEHEVQEHDESESMPDEPQKEEKNDASHAATKEAQPAAGDLVVPNAPSLLEQQNLVEQLEATEKLMASLNETYEDKMKKSLEIQKERETALQEMGIAIKADGGAAGLFTPKKSPHLVNLNEDPLMSELLIYYLSEGTTRLGRPDCEVHQDIPLGGIGIEPQHCVFEFAKGVVTVTPVNNAKLYLNGELISGPKELETGSRLILGESYVFRFVNPVEARKRRETSNFSVMDWAAAQRELLEKQNAEQQLVEKERQAQIMSRMEALEQQIRQEKEAADRLLAVQRQEFEDRLKSLHTNESDVVSAQPVRYPRALAARLQAIVARWRRYRYMSIKSELLSAAILLKEANTISQELQKGVVFQFTLTTPTPYAPEGRRETALGVEVTNLKNRGVSSVWSLAKLRERMYEMRDMYHAAARGKVLQFTTDPFYDRPPWFKLIGRSLLSLKNLIREVPVEVPMLFVNEKGRVVGLMKVHIQPGQLIKNISGGKPSGFHEHEIDFTDYSKNDFDDDLSSSFTNNSETSSVNLERRGEGACDTPTHRRTVSVDPPQAEPSTALNPLFARLGSKFRFVITVLDVVDVSTQYGEVFCQFRFNDKDGTAFSTESLRNKNGGLGFYHTQQVCCEITRDMINYIEKDHVVFELFGHISMHPMGVNPGDNIVDDEAVEDPLLHEPFTPHSVRVNPLDTVVLPSSKKRTISLRNDVLAHIEVLELGPSGEYEPVGVEHNEDMLGDGVFLLQQGVQRRVHVTLSYETGSLKLGHVVEMSMGTVRSSRDIKPADGGKPNVLLSLFSHKSEISMADNKIEQLRMEGAWDSSRHDSLLLNRITPEKERVYATLAILVEVDNCVQPALFRYHMPVKVCVRDSKSTASKIKSLFGPKLVDLNRTCVIFQVTLKPEKSQDEKEKKTQEEFLVGWRPRGMSLVREHRKAIDNVYKILEYENTKQFLAWHDQASMSDHGKPSSGGNAVSDTKALVSRCLHLMATPSLADRVRHDEDVGGKKTPVGSSVSLMSADKKKQAKVVPMFNPEVSKPYITDTVLHKGYLNILEARDSGWRKYFVVVRRPYVLLYDHEKDRVVRGIIHLDSSKVQFNKDQGMIMDVENVFSLCTFNRGLLFQAPKAKDLEVWLSALDPLALGSPKKK